jgi:hypothetical protein
VQWPAIGEDHVVADMAVVPNMRVGQERAVVADCGGHAAAFGARIDRDALADHAIRADRQRGRLALVLEILGFMADRGERENPRARADPCMPSHGHVAEQLHAVTQDDMLAHRAKRTNGDTGPDHRTRVYDR